MKLPAFSIEYTPKIQQSTSLHVILPSCLLLVAVILIAVAVLILLLCYKYRKQQGLTIKLVDSEQYLNIYYNNNIMLFSIDQDLTQTTQAI
jgi:ABC-type uncharacterized transport system permease subunit